MRSPLAIFALVGVFIVSVVGPTVAQEEVLYCWHGEVPDKQNGTVVPATVCRIAGQEEPVAYSAGDPDTPRLDHIDLSVDATGTECWYRTATATQWVLLGVDGNNVAWVGHDPDGLPGGNTVLDANIIACTSEPFPGQTDLERIWELVDEHIHEIPGPAFSPTTGITGLDTLVSVDPPDPVTVTEVSPTTGAVLTAEIKVGAVTINWGDGATDTFTESAFELLTADPEGLARHAYETKTCVDRSAPRCHPTESGYPIELAYEWFVRWRTNAEPWNILAVPDTTAPPTIYDVDEIVVRSVASPSAGNR